jgi:ribosomal protein S5
MLVLAGIKNVTTKLNSGSKNKLNNARVAYKALYMLKDKISGVKSAPFVAEVLKEESKEDLSAQAAVK